MKFRIIFLIALIAAICLRSSSFGLTYYVRQGGSDSNNGTSWATAWSTHTKVNATVVAGDTVQFGDGNWYNVRINVPSGGTSATDRTVYACSSFTVEAAYRTTLWGGEIVGGAPWVCFDSSGSNWKWKKVYAPTASARNAWYGRTDIVTCMVENTKLLRPCRVLNSGEYSIYGSHLDQDTSVWMNGPGTFYYQAIADTAYIWPSTRVDPNTLTYYAAVQEVFSSRSESCDHVTIFGLNIRLGHGLIIWGTSDGGGGDDWRIEYCNLSYASNFKYSNPAAIYHGQTYGASVSSWSQFNYIGNCSLWNVCGDLSGTQVTPHGGSGVALYATRETLIENCYFDQSVFAAGVSLKMGNYPDYGIHAVGNTVRGCTFYGNREYGVWVGEKAEACSVYQCLGYKLPSTFIQLSGGSSTDSTAYTRGNNFICNNTAYKCNALFGSQEAVSGQGTVVKYNLFYDYVHAANQYDNWMRLVSWNGHQPQEFMLIDSNMYHDPATSFIGYCNSNSTNWVQWQACGVDIRGTVGVNPLLDDPENFIVSRLNAASQMDYTYGGVRHTYYGAWQPPPSGMTIIPSPATIRLDAVNPTVKLGNIVINPPAATTRLEAVDPTVRLGSVAITPAPATTRIDAVNPSVVIGNFNAPSAYKFTIKSAGSPIIEDSYISQASPTTNLGAQTVMWTGLWSGATRSMWFAFWSISDTIATGDFGDRTDSARVGIILNTPNLYLDANDTMYVKLVPVRKIPIYTQITWNDAATGVAWEVPGAKGASDIYPASINPHTADSIYKVTGSFPDLDTLWLYVDPAIIDAGVENFLVVAGRPAVDGDERMVSRTTEYGLRMPSMKIWRSDFASVSKFISTRRVGLVKGK